MFCTLNSDAYQSKMDVLEIVQYCASTTGDNK